MGRRKKVKNEAFAVAEPPKEENKEIKIDETVKNDFLDVLYYQVKQRDGLLGEFSLDGKYKISNEKILQALVVLPKLFQEKEDNVLRASTKIGKTTLNFRVDLDINPSYCSAHLSLIEIEHKYDEDVKHVTELADIVEIYSPLFMANVMKAWNIKKEASELDKDDFLAGYLRKQENDEFFLRELSDILAQVYLVRMLKLLENCGEKGLLIKGEYTKLLEMLLAKEPGIMQDNARLKYILDGIILKHNGLDAILQAGGESILKGYSFPIDNVRGKDSAKPVVEPTKAETKTESKKDDKGGKSASKPSKSKPVTASKIPAYKSPKFTEGVFDKPAQKPILKTETEKGKKTAVDNAKSSGESKRVNNDGIITAEDEQRLLEKIEKHNNVDIVLIRTEENYSKDKTIPMEEPQSEKVLVSEEVEAEKNL